MPTIKIRTHADGPWISVALREGERPGWVEVSLADAPRWVAWDDVHPADQVAITFERQAKQRYQWVPPADSE